MTRSLVPANLERTSRLLEKFDDNPFWKSSQDLHGPPEPCEGKRLEDGSSRQLLWIGTGGANSDVREVFAALENYEIYYFWGPAGEEEPAYYQDVNGWKQGLWLSQVTNPIKSVQDSRAARIFNLLSGIETIEQVMKTWYDATHIASPKRKGAMKSKASKPNDKEDKTQYTEADSVSGDEDQHCDSEARLASPARRTRNTGLRIQRTPQAIAKSTNITIPASSPNSPACTPRRRNRARTPKAQNVFDGTESLDQLFASPRHDVAAVLTKRSIARADAEAALTNEQEDDNGESITVKSRRRIGRTLGQVQSSSSQRSPRLIARSRTPEPAVIVLSDSPPPHKKVKVELDEPCARFPDRSATNASITTILPPVPESHSSRPPQMTSGRTTPEADVVVLSNPHQPYKKVKVELDGSLTHHRSPTMSSTTTAAVPASAPITRMSTASAASDSSASSASVIIQHMRSDEALNIYIDAENGKCKPLKLQQAIKVLTGHTPPLQILQNAIVACLNKKIESFSDFAPYVQWKEETGAELRMGSEKG